MKSGLSNHQRRATFLFGVSHDQSELGKFLEYLVISITPFALY